MPVAGVSTLDALAAAATARSRSSTRAARGVRPRPARDCAGRLELEPGDDCIGSGAVRYRATFEDRGAVVPPDEDAIHVPRARLHAALAGDFGPAEAVDAALCPSSGREGAELGMNVELRRLADERSRRGRGDRARVVPDAVVTLDVRRRAAEAELARDRRVRWRRTSSSATRSSRATSTPGT